MWVQFDSIYEFELAEILQDSHNKLLTLKKELHPKNIRAVLNCILKSQDVSGRYKFKIRQTLKKLKSS